MRNTHASDRVDRWSVCKREREVVGGSVEKEGTKESSVKKVAYAWLKDDSIGVGMWSWQFKG